MLSLLLSLSLLVQAVAAPPPPPCANVAAFDEAMKQAGTPTNHYKACLDIAKGIDAEAASSAAAAKKTGKKPKLQADGTQSAAMNNAASQLGAGADNAANLAKIAAASKAKYSGYGDSAHNQLRALDQELGAAQKLSADKAKPMYQASLGARKELFNLQQSAEDHAAMAGKESSKFKDDADKFGKQRDATKKNSERLGGAQSADANPTADSGGAGEQPPAQEQPATPTASPKNALLGIGAVAALGAAAAGGIYLYHQHQKKQDDASAAAAFALAQAQAAQASAAATATMTLTATATAVSSTGGFLMFAVTGSGQIISNASLAAQPIYDRAKTDIGGLTTDLMGEVSAQFSNYTAFDLAKMENELDGVFAGLIARAKAEGNTALVSGLQNTQMQLQSTIQTEINNRGQGSSTATNTSTGSDVRDSSGTSTSTSTMLSTSTVTRQRL